MQWHLLQMKCVLTGIQYPFCFAWASAKWMQATLAVTEGFCSSSGPVFLCFYALTRPARTTLIRQSNMPLSFSSKHITDVRLMVINSLITLMDSSDPVFINDFLTWSFVHVALDYFKILEALIPTAPLVESNPGTQAYLFAVSKSLGVVSWETI